jgi:hypothetical protein
MITRERNLITVISTCGISKMLSDYAPKFLAFTRIFILPLSVHEPSHIRLCFQIYKDYKPVLGSNSFFLFIFFAIMSAELSVIKLWYFAKRNDFALSDC